MSKQRVMLRRQQQQSLHYRHQSNESSSLEPDWDSKMIYSPKALLQPVSDNWDIPVSQSSSGPISTLSSTAASPIKQISTSNDPSPPLPNAIHSNTSTSKPRLTQPLTAKSQTGVAPLSAVTSKSQTNVAPLSPVIAIRHQTSPIAALRRHRECIEDKPQQLNKPTRACVDLRYLLLHGEDTLTRFLTSRNVFIYSVPIPIDLV